jgi:hypothetical protein
MVRIFFVKHSGRQLEGGDGRGGGDERWDDGKRAVMDPTPHTPAVFGSEKLKTLPTRGSQVK